MSERFVVDTSAIPERLEELTKKEQKHIVAKRLRDWEYTGVPDEDDPDLSLPERCIIARRRVDMSTHDVREKYGISHMSVIRYERGQGNFMRLAELWGLA